VFIINWWRFCRGYLVISLRGRGVERLLNLAIARGIGFWDLKRQASGAQLSINLSSFKALRPLVRQTRCRLHIVRKAGLPFWKLRLRRRWGLVAGVLIFGAALYFSTAVVWQVRIIGTEHIDEAEVLELAGQLGLRPGVWKRSLDLAGLEEALARRHPDITWASIRLRGTLALIEIVEQLPEPEIERGPADLVAAKDGLITRVLVLDGEAVVAPGDTVVKGDLLIRGALVVPDHSPGEEQQPEAIPVRARGEVEARVWYEAVAPINRVVPQHIDTGASTKSYLLSWPGKSLRLFGPAESPFDKSRQEVVKWRWRWRNLSLPVELVTVVYHEVHITEKVISESEALQQSRDRAMELLKRQLPEGVKVEQLYFQEFREQSQDYVRAVAETLENIAEYRPLNP